MRPTFKILIRILASIGLIFGFILDYFWLIIPCLIIIIFVWIDSFSSVEIFGLKSYSVNRIRNKRKIRNRQTLKVETRHFKFNSDQQTFTSSETNADAMGSPIVNINHHSMPITKINYRWHKKGFTFTRFIEGNYLEIKTKLKSQRTLQIHYNSKDLSKYYIELPGLDK